MEGLATQSGQLTITADAAKVGKFDHMEQYFDYCNITSNVNKVMSSIDLMLT